VIALPPLSPSYVETMRDWSIIFMGIATAAFFFVALIVLVVIGLLLRSLLKKTLSVVDENVRPLLDTAKDTAGTANETMKNVRGTTSYVSEAAVTPIIRAYGVVAGVRRAAAVLAGITGATNGKREE